MPVAYIQIRKYQITSKLKEFGIKSKYHNQLCEFIKKQIFKDCEFITRNCATAFIMVKNIEKGMQQQLNPQKKLIEDKKNKKLVDF